MRCLLASLLALTGLCTASLIVPAGIQPSDIRPAEHTYVATLFVGTPPEEMKMEVRFDVAGIWIDRQQDTHSASHIVDDGGDETDIVYFGSTRQRIPVHDECRYRLPHMSSPPYRLCSRCDGFLGLRSDSDVWQFWPSASFTAASITFGRPAPPLRSGHHTSGAVHTWEIPCEDLDNETALCVVSVEWEGTLYRAIIDPGTPFLLVPRHVKRAYMTGKNIFDTSEWPYFVLTLPDAKPFESSDRTDPLAVAFERSDLMGRHGAEALDMLIDVYDKRNDTMVIGSMLLSRLVLYRTGARDTLFVHTHPVFPNLPVSHSILFFFAFFFYVRWKVTDIKRHYARLPRRLRIGAIDTTYQVLGWILALVSIFLPDTWVIMQDTPGLHVTAGVTIGVGIVVEATVRYFLWKVRVFEDEMRTSPKVSPTMYALLLLESVWHESVLATAMWLLVVPRRKEGLAGPITAMVGFVSIYSVTVHFIFLSVFVGAFLVTSNVSGKGKKSAVRKSPTAVLRGVISAATVSVLYNLALFIFLFIWIFALPMVQNIAAIYSDLATATVVGVAIIAVIAGAMISDNYITHTSKGVVRQKMQAIKDREDVDEEAAQDTGVARRLGKR